MLGHTSALRRQCSLPAISSAARKRGQLGRPRARSAWPPLVRSVQPPRAAISLAAPQRGQLGRPRARSVQPPHDAISLAASAAISFGAPSPIR